MSPHRYRVDPRGSRFSIVGTDSRAWVCARSDRFHVKGIVMRFGIGHHRSGSPAAKPATSPRQFNFEHAQADVRIAAWQCPVHVPQGATAEWFERNCTLPLENVNFQMVDAAANAAIEMSGNHDGTGHFTIAADPTPGYAQQPYMLCDIMPAEATDGSPHRDAAPVVRCNWYTWQLTPGDITVYAWECPEGYDHTAAHADPMADCIGIASGAHFRLQNSHPEHELLATSGAYRTGAARFGDLEPGEYTLSELTDPGADTDTILWQCFGFDHELQSTPVGAGSDISFSITGGEHIMCHRFHIPHRTAHIAR